MDGKAVFLCQVRNSPREADRTVHYYRVLTVLTVASSLHEISAPDRMTWIVRSCFPEPVRCTVFNTLGCDVTLGGFVLYPYSLPWQYTGRLYSTCRYGVLYDLDSTRLDSLDLLLPHLHYNVFLQCPNAIPFSTNRRLILDDFYSERHLMFSKFILCYRWCLVYPPSQTISSLAVFGQSGPRQACHPFFFSFTPLPIAQPPSERAPRIKSLSMSLC